MDVGGWYEFSGESFKGEKLILNSRFLSGGDVDEEYLPPLLLILLKLLPALPVEVSLFLIAIGVLFSLVKAFVNSLVANGGVSTSPEFFLLNGSFE
jgi:hypothetical protein